MADSDESAHRSRLSRALTFAEDGLYLAVGLVLAATSVVIIHSTFWSFIDAIRTGEMISRSVEILDSMLLVLLIVEIMHTIRVSIAERALIAEPFLVVALIAVIRRMLILLVEAKEFLSSQEPFFERVLWEMGVLIALILVIVGSLAFMRRFGRVA